MTSMIDVLVVLTVFLLITFEASPMCHATNRKLPIAPNAPRDVADAPLIDVGPGGVFLDGAKAETNADLVTKLEARRDLWKQLHPGHEHERPENVLLVIEQDVPSGTVKGIVKAAADGGYPSIDFMVTRF